MIHILCAASVLFFFTFSDLYAAEQIKKPKIMILTSSGGRGHTSATEALHEYFDADYQVHEVNLLRDILGSLDMLKQITSALYDTARYSTETMAWAVSQLSQISIYPHMMVDPDQQLMQAIHGAVFNYGKTIFEGLKQFGYEDLYNFLLTQDQTMLIDIMQRIGLWYFPKQNEQVFSLIDAYIAHEKPDLIISVIPLFNDITVRVARRYNTLFWIIPTDFDATLYVKNLRKDMSTQCFVNVCINDSLIIDSINKEVVNSKQYTYAGMPIRIQFLKTYNITDIKAHYNVSADKTVIMIMLGGRGSKEMLALAQQLAKVRGAVHYLFCIGKAENLKQPLQKIIDMYTMSATIVPFTREIASLMAIADLLITKPGGQTVSEALYMRLPMLLDIRSTPLMVEAFNRKFVTERNLGIAVTKLDDYVAQVQQIIGAPEILKKWRNNIAALQLQNPRDAMRAFLKNIMYSKN